MPAKDPVDRLTLAETRDRIKRIREILWPRRDPDEFWSPDHLDMIGHLVEDLRLEPASSGEEKGVAADDEPSPQGDKPKVMKRYHFDFGDSTHGPVGFCAMVRATSPEEAVDKLKGAVPDDQDVPVARDVEPDVKYVQVYFNPEVITEDAIDFAWIAAPLRRSPATPGSDRS